MAGSRDRRCEGRLGRAVRISGGVWNAVLNAVSGRPVVCVASRASRTTEKGMIWKSIFLAGLGVYAIANKYVVERNSFNKYSK